MLNIARQEQQPYQQEIRVIWSDGSIHWSESKGRFFYDETGQAVRMMGIVLDISDRKRMELALRDDVMMPDMDGITTFEKLQANVATQHISVILLTAKIQAADRRRYADLGLKAAIAKPFDALALATQVAAVLRWHLYEN